MMIPGRGIRVKLIMALAFESGAAPHQAEKQDFDFKESSIAAQAFLDDAFGMVKKSSDKTESRSEKTELSERIVRSAESLRGEQLWYPDYAKITQNGSLGCAISVATALRKAGVDVGMHTTVKALVKDLDADNWDKYPIEQAQPGDVAVGHNTKLGTNHIGIIGRGGWIWNNSSRALPQNVWISESLTFGLRPGWLFDGYDQRYVLRPPRK